MYTLEGRDFCTFLGPQEGVSGRGTLLSGHGLELPGRNAVNADTKGAQEREI